MLPLQITATIPIVVGDGAVTRYSGYALLLLAETDAFVINARSEILPLTTQGYFNTV